jgi:hypothetical protein
LKKGPSQPEIELSCEPCRFLMFCCAKFNKKRARMKSMTMGERADYKISLRRDLHYFFAIQESLLKNFFERFKFSVFAKLFWLKV